MKIGVGCGDRLGVDLLTADPAEASPGAAGILGNLFGYVARQVTAAARFVSHVGVARVLQDFAHVGKRLVQSAAARRGRLDYRARAALAGNQPFVLQPAQRLANGEARYPVTLAQVTLGRELITRGKLAGQDFGAQFPGNLQIAGGFTQTRNGHAGLQSLLPSGTRGRR